MSSYASYLLSLVPGAPEPKGTSQLGCLLDVSKSMRQNLEIDSLEDGTTERLNAVFGAALKLARAEEQRHPDASMFVGIFGLSGGYRMAVDLCGIVDALIVGDDHKTAHELLIEIANAHDRAYVAKYINSKLTDGEARILSVHLRQDPSRIKEFVNAIPLDMPVSGTAPRRESQRETRKSSGAMRRWVRSLVFVRAFRKTAASTNDAIDNLAVEHSEAMELVHRVQDKWPQDFQNVERRSVADVASLLERLQKLPGAGDAGDANDRTGGSSLFNTLSRHMYGEHSELDMALMSAERAFRGVYRVGQYYIPSSQDKRVLLLISDNNTTGPKNDISSKRELLEQMNVIIATVFLTSNRAAPRRRLYDRAANDWDEGQLALFNAASKVSGNMHPIPVLAAMGWDVPSSGECALFTTVCSVESLDEFCSMLLSANFGSADSLLDIMGSVELDAVVNDEQVRTCNNPSDQGQSSTCYAHAIAAVIYMALIRIPGREGGCPSIREIRERILRDFPPGPYGRVSEQVLQAATTWYRPLRYRQVDEDGARQAVLRRRPLLATFRLSQNGWNMFSSHFAGAASRKSTLTLAEMNPFRSQTDGGGHAVVMVGCDPRSLTFLNSWGNQWGNNGSFSIESPFVLELEGQYASQMQFFDVYWIESDLTAVERKAYDDKATKALHDRAKQYPSIFELETHCPHCKASAPIADFTGSVRQAVCPLCKQSFRPEPGHLVQALYARAGLNVVV